MLRIGITGGIGSGKSTVANYFASLGVPIIDADIIAREVTARGTSALAKIQAYFGDEIINTCQELDRPKLRQIIFHDPVKRQWLENLLHPLIIEKIKIRSREFTAPYCIIVIPLLFETHQQHWLDKVIVVDVAEHLQTERLQQRDITTTPATLAAIQKAQLARNLRLACAHEVIDNNGSLEELKQRVFVLHEKYDTMGRLG